MSSFRPKVDYSLRPGKGTVRRMVIEALSKLSPLIPVESYRYVGMGSIYFRDFQMVHRRLGVTNMTSIEGVYQAKTRVLFNRPLSCIDVSMGMTHSVLPKIALNQIPHIVWLDYESRLDPGVLSDVEDVIQRGVSGSVLIATMNADRPEPNLKRQQWLDAFNGPLPQPNDPKKKSEYALLAYRILKERIESALNLRNAGHPTNRYQFHQMFHMIHTDGAQMLTVGGVLTSKQQNRKWDACNISSLDFTRSGENSLKIDIPNLTRTEVSYLLRSMPITNGDFDAVAANAGIPSKDVRSFANIYRYTPLFVESEDW